MADFLPAVETTLANEKGYVNDPADHGGETNFGISKREYPDLDIKNLTREQAIAIYRRDYWRFSDIDDQTLANKVFDMAVIMGVDKAVEYLQLAIVAAGIVITVDRKLGPETIKAANRIEPAYLLKVYIDELVQRAQRIVLADPTQARFYHGWIDRFRR